MLFRNRIRDLAVEILIAENTLAGAKVFKTRAQPIRGGEPPLLLIFSPTEKGEGMGAGVTRFRSVLTLVMQPIVSGGDDEAVGADLDLLCGQAVDALLTSQDFLRIPPEDGVGRAIEEFKFLHTATKVEHDGKEFVGSGVIQLGIQYVDRYAPRGGVPLEAISVTGDAGNVYSPTGAFTDDAQAGFANARLRPAPRTAGLDGRAEFSFVIPFQDQDPPQGSGT